MSERALQRTVIRGQTQWLTTDRIEAYGRWKANGSLTVTATEMGIPMDTLSAWCRREGWVKRRQQEDALEQELALQRVWVKIVEDADPLVHDLLEIAHTGTKEDSVRLSAVKHALAIIGIAPIERQPMGTGRRDDSHQSAPALSSEALSMIEGLLAEPSAE